MTLAKSLLNEKIHIVEGNKKLEGSDDSVFLIFNIPAQKTCPYMTDICKFICYAASEERRFPSVVKSRQENFLESLQSTFVDDMINHIEYQINRPKNKGKKIFIRVHSSGDFYNRQYFSKWIAITNFFKGCDNVVFEAYTKSLEYVMERNILEINMTLVYSVMPDTDPENITIAKQIGMKTFNALPIGSIPYNSFKCPGKCGPCVACYHKDNKINDIYTEFHGARAKTKMPQRGEDHEANSL